MPTPPGSPGGPRRLAAVAAAAVAPPALTGCSQPGALNNAAPVSAHGAQGVAIWTSAPARSEIVPQGEFTCRVYARVAVAARGLSLRVANDYGARPTKLAAVTAGIRSGRKGADVHHIRAVTF